MRLYHVFIRKASQALTVMVFLVQGYVTNFHLFPKYMGPEHQRDLIYLVVQQLPALVIFSFQSRYLPRTSSGGLFSALDRAVARYRLCGCAVRMLSLRGAPLAACMGST